MLNKYTKMIVSGAILVAVSIFAILATRSGPVLTHSNICALGRSPCVIKTPDYQVSITLQNQQVVLEQETFVDIQVKNAQLTEAWIEGVNMYMGKIPLMQERDSTHVFFLGSCSEPDMHWRLNIILEDNTGSAHSHYVDFYTQR